MLKKFILSISVATVGLGGLAASAQANDRDGGARHERVWIEKSGQGDNDDKGGKGDKGDKGGKGNKGDKGDKGDKGGKGNKGDKGNHGDKDE